MTVHYDSSRREAFLECLDHIDVLFRLARRLGAEPSHAADLVQDTYLEAWRSFSRFTPNSNARAWLCRILYRVWYRDRQRRLREPLLFDSALVETPRFEAATEPESTTFAELEEAFDGLSEKHRAVVTLADIEGFSYREVGHILGIPIGTVMSRLSRARAQIRRRLTLVRRTNFRVIDKSKTGTR